MFITGTIRNAVKLQVLDNKWQQRKENFGKKNGFLDLTAEQKQMQTYKEQLEDIRKSNQMAEISMKLKAGAYLTPEEIAYLRKNNPEALREYEKLQKERETYKKQLENCKSKEEVENLRMTKLEGFMAQAKDISNNPRIPKGKKLELLGKLLNQIAGFNAEYEAFTKTLQYHTLPEKDKDRKHDDMADEIAEESADNVNTDQELADANPEDASPDTIIKDMVGKKTSEIRADSESDVATLVQGMIEEIKKTLPAGSTQSLVDVSI